MATGKATVNKVILVGNLGQDPELKTTENNVSVLTLPLATNRVWQDKDGNTQESVDWHRVVLWGKFAEAAAKYLSKGSKIYVEGFLRTRQWQDQDGETKYTTEVVAERFTMLDAKTDESASAEPETESADDAPGG